MEVLLGKRSLYKYSCDQFSISSSIFLVLKILFKFDVKIAKHAILFVVKVTAYLVLHTGYIYDLNWKNLCNNLFNLLMKFYKFFLIVNKKSLNIPDAKEEDFYDNINFYVQGLLLDGNVIYERRYFINNIFNYPRETLFSYFIFCEDGEIHYK